MYHILTSEDKEFIKHTIQLYEQQQIIVAIEELGELSLELICKNRQAVLEELADCIIMMENVRQYFQIENLPIIQDLDSEESFEIDFILMQKLLCKHLRHKNIDAQEVQILLQLLNRDFQIIQTNYWLSDEQIKVIIDQKLSRLKTKINQQKEVQA